MRSCWAIMAWMSAPQRAARVLPISQDAKRFYERRGFQPSPVDPMTLMITLRDAERVLAENGEGSV